MFPRKNYGATNYSEAMWTVDPFAAEEAAQSRAGFRFNFGNVYVNARRQVGGVRAGDNGQMPTRNMWYGVIGALLRPIGLTSGQTYLSQTAANPVAWAGDTPVDMQPQMIRTAPWRRAALSPVRVTQ